MQYIYHIQSSDISDIKVHTGGTTLLLQIQCPKVVAMKNASEFIYRIFFLICWTWLKKKKKKKTCPVSLTCKILDNLSLVRPNFMFIIKIKNNKIKNTIQNLKLWRKTLG